MGCDIHAFVEIRKNDIWAHYDWRKKFQIGQYEDGSKKYDWDKMFEHPLWIDRNYSLFGMLANVRNGVGFAGCDTGNGFVSISEPKGLPQDVSSEVQIESDNWGIDGHSHSHATLAELQEYFAIKRVTLHRGWVDYQNFLEWKQTGKQPSRVSGDVFGHNIRKVEQEDMREDCYTRIEWKTTYLHAARQFVEKVMPELAKLGEPENVRLVFFFDN